METNIFSFQFKDDGEIPNNAKLPVIVYAGIFVDNPDGIEPVFNRHGWTNTGQMVYLTIIITKRIHMKCSG